MGARAARRSSTRPPGKWTVLRKKEKPAAEIFSVSYVAEDGDRDRPVTFVFNGGPGAASAYLHMGAVGPQRVDFPPDGTLPTVPPRLVENESSWLAFSDLVFVDPVGTGFSRVIEPEKKGDGKDGASRTRTRADPKEYFGYKRDLESLCEFMGRWLSENGRWGSPVFIAGESYGGYRVGRLARMLQEAAGIGLNGAILISPALEITGLTPTDYDVLGWVDRVPTMAAAALHHGRSRAFRKGTSLEKALRDVRGVRNGRLRDRSSRAARRYRRRSATRILSRLADLVGLPLDVVVRAEGRVGILTFVRELLRDERKVLGLYDTTITATDPFPDRDDVLVARPDALGHQPRVHDGRQPDAPLGDRRRDGPRVRAPVVRGLHVVEERCRALTRSRRPPGATDDFRYGMALNPHMKAFITHGQYDLVTPYYASDRLRNLMRLDPQMADAHRPALRRRAHVLRVGVEQARVRGSDRRLRRDASSRARRRTPASASARAASCPRSAEQPPDRRRTRVAVVVRSRRYDRSSFSPDRPAASALALVRAHQAKSSPT